MTLKRPPVCRQRGITMFGLLFWAIVIGMLALVVMRVVPTVIEYYSVIKVVNRISGDSGLGTVPEIRNAFDRQKDIDQVISAISGKDLEITKENEQVVVGFAYDKEIELYAPVYLLIKYQGRSKGGRPY